MNETASKRSPLGWLMVLSPLILFGALVFLFASQLMSGRDSSELPSALIDGPAPQFDLPHLKDLKRAGVQVPGLKTADLKGGLYLVNIFASWCGPCRTEHPVLMQLAKDERISIVGINYKDDPGNARRFLGALGNPYDRVGVDEKGRTAIDWGFYGIPETLLVDAKGVVRHKVIGPISAKKMKVLQEAITKHGG